MQTAAARQNFRMSGGGISPACIRRKSRRNARFTSISATSVLTYTETFCIKDSVGMEVLSNQEKLTLEYLSKTILSGVRPYELEILKHFAQKENFTVDELMIEMEEQYQEPVDWMSVERAVRVLQGDLVLKEHEAAKWLSKEELDSVDWLPADRKLIPEIRKVL